MAGDSPVTWPLVPSLNSSAVWPTVSCESSRTRFGQAEGVADVDRAVQSLHAQRRDGAAAEVDRVGTVLAVDVQRVVAGGEHVGVVVARARVEGCRVEARRVIHDERVAAAAAVDRQWGEIGWIVGRGGAAGHRDAAA